MVETLQSLIVAFVLAMTFRGFVTEGFVIPTGSMAPTLLGRHIDARSAATGWQFTLGVDKVPQTKRELERLRQALRDTMDPMLGTLASNTVVGGPGTVSPVRMGDRILVLKSLFPFHRPQRFDVVVFKNPTDPNGEAGNYIKRLVGLPSEATWLADGDVFATGAEQADDLESYRVQRKPEHVQRAVWQPIHRTDYIPLTAEIRDRFRESPWRGDDGWTSNHVRALRCELATPTELEWDPHVLPIRDWSSYNMLSRGADHNSGHVSDLRVAASVVPDQAGLDLVFRLDVRGERIEYRLVDGTIGIRWRSLEYGDEYPDQGWTWLCEAAPADLFTPGEPTDLEFWHVDQAVWLFVNGRRLGYGTYEWNPVERLQRAAGRPASPRELSGQNTSKSAQFKFVTEGTPLTLHRVEVDRDLHYRAGTLSRLEVRRNPTLPQYESLLQDRAYGTHPDNIAILGPDHFFMLGDNSAASSDSRMWCNPHPLVVAQIDDHPFVVHRRLLLGKAWVVYFPSPQSLTPNGHAFIPDFGRLRFIR